MVNYKSLIGRQWKYGFFDCYTIVRDYYKLLGISLPDYERPKDVETCESIFLKESDKLNFEEVNINDRRPNDVLIMKEICLLEDLSTQEYKFNDI